MNSAHSNIKQFGVLIAGIMLMITGLVLYSAQEANAASTDRQAQKACVSQSEFKAIKKGMTKAQVHNAVHGQKTDSAKPNYESYISCSTTLVEVFYKNNKVTSKHFGVFGPSRSQGCSTVVFKAWGALPRARVDVSAANDIEMMRRLPYRQVACLSGWDLTFSDISVEDPRSDGYAMMGCSITINGRMVSRDVSDFGFAWCNH